LCLQY